MPDRYSSDQVMRLLLDSHCHLDFYNQPATVATLLLSGHTSLLSMSMNPQSWHTTIQACSELTLPCLNSDNEPHVAQHLYPEVVADINLFKSAHIHYPVASDVLSCITARHQTGSHLYLGLGMHPWLVDNTEISYQHQKTMLHLLRHTQGLTLQERLLIGEIGLDFSTGYRGHMDIQRRFFAQLCAALSTSAPCLLSLHAVEAAGEVLNLLMHHRVCERHRVIIHWFNGSGDELVAARNLGCMFSVNTRMLSTKRGRSYAAQIPIHQLLLETDGPRPDWRSVEPTQGARMHTEDLLTAAQTLADIRGIGMADLLQGMPSVEALMALET